MPRTGYQLTPWVNTLWAFALVVGAGGCSVREVGPFEGSWVVDEQALESWEPEGADPQADPGLLWKSRLWVTPNPILLAIPPDGPYPACFDAHFFSIGTDPLTLTAMRLEGQLSPPPEEVIFESFTLSNGGVGGSNGFGFSLCSSGVVAPGPVGEVIFDSDDPTAPEIRIPVHAMHLLDIPYDVQLFDIVYHSRLHFSPNPVRVVHSAGDTTIEVVATRVGQEPLNLLGVEALGPDVTVSDVTLDGVAGWDGSYPVVVPELLPNSGEPGRVRITLSYSPTSVEPHDDALLVAFDDGDLESYRVVVPIVVR